MFQIRHRAKVNDSLARNSQLQLKITYRSPVIAHGVWAISSTAGSNPDQLATFPAQQLGEIQ